MKSRIVSAAAFCLACLVVGAQAQNSSGGSGSMGGSSSPGGVSNWQSQGLSPTGRMGPQDLRASQITGAGIKGSSGQNLGTINDVILNPTSGRIDFAVISLNASTAGATGSSAAGNLGSAAQLVPVPWSLLHPVSTGSASASSSEMGASQEQPSFVFTGDTSRLQGAPSFTEGNWPDISQPSWRHSVFSYYGVMHGSSMGGGEAPGGAGGTRSEGAAGSQNTSGSSSGNP